MILLLHTIGPMSEWFKGGGLFTFEFNHSNNIPLYSTVNVSPKNQSNKIHYNPPPPLTKLTLFAPIMYTSFIRYPTKYLNK